MHKPLTAALALSALAAAAAWAAERPPQGPQFGRPVSPAALAAADISIGPDGVGLPPGRGDAAAGAQTYAAKCRSCHGEAGAGGPMDRLTGGVGTLASAQPVKTVASYWPYATTLFDYTRRAMPLQAPQTLSDDEVYALVAYLLSVDGIVAPGAVMDARTLPQVRMPNRDGFVRREPGR